MNITTDELQYIFDKIVDKMSESGIKLSLDKVDMYWTINPPECYNMSKVPSLEVGSLNDDINELKKILSDNESEHQLTFVDLDRFASVLHAVSHTLNPI